MYNTLNYLNTMLNDVDQTINALVTESKIPADTNREKLLQKVVLSNIAVAKDKKKSLEEIKHRLVAFINNNDGLGEALQNYDTLKAVLAQIRSSESVEINRLREAGMNYLEYRTFTVLNLKDGMEKEIEYYEAAISNINTQIDLLVPIIKEIESIRNAIEEVI